MCLPAQAHVRVSPYSVEPAGKAAAQDEAGLLAPGVAISAAFLLLVQSRNRLTTPHRASSPSAEASLATSLSQPPRYLELRSNVPSWQLRWSAWRGQWAGRPLQPPSPPSPLSGTSLWPARCPFHPPSRHWVPAATRRAPAHSSRQQRPPAPGPSRSSLLPPSSAAFSRGCR